VYNLKELLIVLSIRHVENERQDHYTEFVKKIVPLYMKGDKFMVKQVNHEVDMMLAKNKDKFFEILFEEHTYFIDRALQALKVLRANYPDA
jgi:hypothetical protein